MVIMLLFMGCSFTLFELQKEGKNTGFNYKTKSQMSLNVSILKLYLNTYDNDFLKDIYLKDVYVR